MLLPVLKGENRAGHARHHHFYLTMKCAENPPGFSNYFTFYPLTFCRQLNVPVLNDLSLRISTGRGPVAYHLAAGADHARDLRH